MGHRKGSVQRTSPIVRSLLLELWDFGTGPLQKRELSEHQHPLLYYCRLMKTKELRQPHRARKNLIMLLELFENLT